MELLPIIIFAIISAVIKSTNKKASEAQKAVRSKRAPKEPVEKIEAFLDKVLEKLEDDDDSEEKKPAFDQPEKKVLKPAAPAAAQNAVNAVRTKIDQKAAEPHEHEGKQGIPCPADERELRADQPVIQRKAPAATKTVPGLKLNFDRDSVLQAFVLNEVLNRPRSASRR